MMSSRNRLQKFRNLVLFGLVSLTLIVVLVVVGLCYIEVRGWLYPTRLTILPQPDDSRFTKVTFKTEDGLTIHGWYMPSQSGRVVLMFHGLGGNRDQLLPHAEYLIDGGYGVLLVDFRNHGESEGHFTSMGYHEIMDARTAYDWLLTQDNVQQIVIWGHSMGAGVASQLMHEVDADGLIIDAVFVDFLSIVQSGVKARKLPTTPISELLLTMAGWLSNANWYDLRPLDKLVGIDKPILLLHGTLDPVIPIENAYHLAESNPHIRLVVVDGGAHSDLFALEPDTYRDEIMMYLNQVLK